MKLRPQAETLSGSPQPNFIGYATAPILAKRAPTTTDTGYPLGQLWVDKVGAASYQLLTVAAGSATWSPLGGGTADVSTINTLSPTGGNITIAGTANQVSIGNAGSTVTLSLPSAITAPGSVTTTTSLTATLGNITATNGNLVLTAAGNKMIRTSVASTTAAGANSIGSVTLVGGTATISTTAVTTSSLIQIWRQSVGATGATALGQLSVGTIVNGTSFVINAWSATDATSLQASDVSVIGWEIIN